MRVSYQQRRNIMHKAFVDMGLPCVEPEGAFYMFPDIRSTGMESEEFAKKLLETKKVAVVPGTAFGKSGEGFLRISYAYSMENLKIAIDRLERFINRLRGIS